MFFDRSTKSSLAFGRSTTGIEFDALDNAPVKFVVLHCAEKSISDALPISLHCKFLNDRSVAKVWPAQNPPTNLSIFTIVRNL